MPAPGLEALARELYTLIVSQSTPFEQPHGARRCLTVCGYVSLVLGCCLAGYLLMPAPDAGDRPATVLERVKLPRPQPLAEFALEDIDGAGTFTRDRLLDW